MILTLSKKRDDFQHLGWFHPVSNDLRAMQHLSESYDHLATVITRVVDVAVEQIKVLRHVHFVLFAGAAEIGVKYLVDRLVDVQVDLHLRHYLV